MKERIKEIRNNKGMNQASFAEDLGISVSNIQSYETGRRIPSEAFIQLICSKYDVNEAWLRTGEGEMFSPITREKEIAQITKKIFNDEIPDEAQALMKVLADMNQEQSEYFVEFMRNFKNELEKIEHKKDLPEE